VLDRPKGRVVYLRPPFVTSDVEMEALTGAIRSLLQAARIHA
jgi:adenosylmethionine-8-amino-7-oxononanoate aminotransferase